MPKLEKPFVLIVDDNEATLTLLTALLHRDFEIEVATDGQEAIDKLRTKRYGATLLDLRMPNVDGFSVLEFLRQEQPDSLRNVIVVTAALSKGELSRVDQYKVCAVVPKPFEVESLLGLVRECTGSEDVGPLGRIISSGVILLLADILKQRLM